jgi:GTP-binding protein HflX
MEPKAWITSAHHASLVSELHAAIVAFFEQSMREEAFVLPYSASRGVALLHAHTHVLEERHEPEGTHIRVRAPEAVLGGLRRELAKHSA